MSKKQEVNHDLIGDIALDLIENDWPNVGAQIQEYVQQNEKREATQTRWVKCSERTPLTPGYYIVAVSENSTGPATALAHWSVGAQLWTSYYSDAVVAWLENVPEYVP